MRKTLLSSYALSLAFTLSAASVHNVAQAQPNMITTVAGTGTSGYTGDGGPAVSARMSFPVSVDVDATGDLFIADYSNNVIRKVATTGIITTVAGNGTSGYAGDGGPATAARLSAVACVVSDNSGSLYISDQGYGIVRKVDAAGIISTVAGTGTPGFSGDGGPGTAAMLSKPAGIALDDTGNLYIADVNNYIIRKLSPAGIITTYAGNSSSSAVTGNGGPATAARLGQVFALCTDHAGNLYFSETWPEHTIRKVDASGIITLVAGDDSAAAYASGTVAATTVQIGSVLGLAVDDSGNLCASMNDAVPGYIIVKITAGGIMSTFAGNGSGGFGGDGGGPLSAAIDPYGICFGNSGEMYLASGTRVRRIGRNTTSVDPVEPSPKISIFPNPCTDRLNIWGLSGKGTISLMDITGRILLEQQYNASTQSVSLSMPAMLMAGTYLLWVTGDNVVTSKIISLER